MIVEYIRYKLSPKTSAEFEAAYQVAATSLDASSHCLGYELSRCHEEPDRYILRIEWDSVEGHLAGFRRSPEFTAFFAAVKPYLSQIEEMQHYNLTPIRTSKIK